MESTSESINSYLQIARMTDPEAAERLEQAIREQRARSIDADFAAQDLTWALVGAALDLQGDSSADEHLSIAIGGHPIDGLDAVERLAIARQFLLGVVAGETEPGSQTADTRLFLNMLDGSEGEAGVLEQIGLLRAAVGHARAAAQPTV